MPTVKSVLPRYKFYGVKHIFTMGFLKFVPMIFMNYEINKIDLGASFFRIFKIPMVKNLDHQVKLCSAKKYLRAKQILQESIFVINLRKKTFLAMLHVHSLAE